jgi:hypothetical protein
VEPVTRNELFNARNPEHLFQLLTRYLGRRPDRLELRRWTNTVLGPWHIPPEVLAQADGLRGFDDAGWARPDEDEYYVGVEGGTIRASRLRSSVVVSKKKKKKVTAGKKKFSQQKRTRPSRAPVNSQGVTFFQFMGRVNRALKRAGGLTSGQIAHDWRLEWEYGTDPDSLAEGMIGNLREQKPPWQG